MALDKSTITLVLAIVAVVLSASALGLAISSSPSNTSSEPIVKVCSVTYDGGSTAKNWYKLTLYCDNIPGEGYVHWEFLNSSADPEGGGEHLTHIFPQDGPFFVTISLHANINYLDGSGIVVKGFSLI